jgi:hypothetical protein
MKERKKEVIMEKNKTRKKYRINKHINNKERTEKRKERKSE